MRIVMSFLRCCCGHRPSAKNGIEAPQTQIRNQKLIAAARRVLDDYSPPVAVVREESPKIVVTPKSVPQKSAAEAAEFLKHFDL